MDFLSLFDFLIVIENFVRYESLLRKNVTEHLKKIEEEILEWRIWETGNSEVYELAKFESPRKALVSISTTLTTRQEKMKRFKVTRKELFFRKLFRFVEKKISFLCGKLQVSAYTKQKIWDLFAEIVENEIQLRILFKRRVDQIIMCCLYSVTKLYDDPILFKDIVQAAGEVGQSTEIYTKVWINDNSDGDIVAFYNKVFLQKTQMLLQKIRSTSDVCLSPLPLKRRTSINFGSTVTLSPMSEHKKVSKGIKRITTSARKLSF